MTEYVNLVCVCNFIQSKKGLFCSKIFGPKKKSKNLLKNFFSIRLKASGFNQVYKYDTPKRRRRRQIGTSNAAYTDGTDFCVVNFQLTLENPDRTNLEEKTNVQVFSIFQSETGQTTDTLIGEIDMTPKSSVNVS